MGDTPEPHTSLMCCNQRRVRSCISDDSIMRDATTETRDLHVSVLHAGASQMSLPHIVHDGGVHGGAMVMENTMIPNAILFTISYDHICACNIYFLVLLFYLCLICGGCYVTIE
jgi:hypothetical protein